MVTPHQWDLFFDSHCGASSYTRPFTMYYQFPSVPAEMHRDLVTPPPLASVCRRPMVCEFPHFLVRYYFSSSFRKWRPKLEQTYTVITLCEVRDITGKIMTHKFSYILLLTLLQIPVEEIVLEKLHMLSSAKAEKPAYTTYCHTDKFQVPVNNQPR